MKLLTIISLMLVIAGTGLRAQKQTVPGAQKPKQILYDFRVDKFHGPPKLAAHTQKAILARVFHKYLNDASECDPQFDAGSSSDPLQAARKAGQIVPSILDMATGSFTAPRKQETIYVIAVSECNASHADNFGTKRVAIYSGQQYLADMDVDFRSSIVKQTDLDGDGINELLMTGGDMNQGTAVAAAALLDFKNGRMRVIQDFGTVSEDSCASEERGSSAKASVISFGTAGPGEMPKLRMDNYRSSCRDLKHWRFISSGKMPD